MEKRKNTIQVAVASSPELHDQVKALAEKTRRSVSKMALILVEIGLKNFKEAEDGF